MRVFGFDLLAYPEHLDHLKVNGELPYPLPKRFFRPDIAIQNYREHLDAWALMEAMGFDGIGFNEHHTSPFGLMTSPNLMAAAASQRLQRMQILIYGNLLPLHEPLRLAEELAMLDCLTGGRLIAGVARGIPREHLVYNVSMAESRARFEEAWEIIKLAWAEEVFSYQGTYWSYKDVAIWPRPVQQPYPPVWAPVSRSQETLEWAARENIPITPGALGTLVARQDMVRYYAACLARHGRSITPDHIVAGANVHIADSREQAFKTAGPYLLYFLQTLFSHGNLYRVERQRESGYVREESLSWLRPEHREEFLHTLQGFRRMTMADLPRNDQLCWGTPAQVCEALIGLAEALGANTLLVQFNQGAMPHEMFVDQIKRFGEEVLPAIKQYQMTTVALA
jgi:alkanesulfonate monooxygenase SsuD/methylene tetrahydromethanopterin reductase-like flavin-dependent oxidoreductase (luciferase family)